MFNRSPAHLKVATEEKPNFILFADCTLCASVIATCARFVLIKIELLLSNVRFLCIVCRLPHCALENCALENSAAQHFSFLLFLCVALSYTFFLLRLLRAKEEKKPKCQMK